MGLALRAYFYCDFRDSKKQDSRGLLSSFLAQLAAESKACFDILSALYSDCGAGTQQPSDHVLLDCFEKMLKIGRLPIIYIIIDGLDECPSAPGVKPPLERVLELVKNLVDFHLSNVRICVTSRPEADIQASFAPLPCHTISLHDEDGQKKDIREYVRSTVYSDRRMRRWGVDNQEMVIGNLSQRDGGM
jgi:NACHT domain-containing protein